MKESVLIKGGTIIDGTGQKPYQGDVLVKWGRIVALGNLSGACADLELNGEDQVVCPGFIDTHVHSDLDLLRNPDHSSALAQGITTEILGQDGLAYAPLSADNLREYGAYLEGLNGPLPKDLSWSSVAEFRRLFHRTTAINTVYQVPHGALRLETVGWADVPLEGVNLKKAQALLAQGFQEGAAAFSTGLSYYPCSFADTREMIELCRVAAAYKKPYVTHLRTVFPGAPFDAVEEAIQIAEESGAALHISHFRTTPETVGRAHELMAPIEAAHERGVDITLETYAHPAGAGFTMVMLPRWAHVGGFAGLMTRLADPQLKKRMVQDMVKEGLLHDGIFTYLPPGSDQDLIGQTIYGSAKERNMDPALFVCELMLRNRLQVGYMSVPPEEDVWNRIEADIRELIQKPYYMVGSDSISPAPRPHPRTFATFPRFLRWQREMGFMPLEALIQRMTSIPARRFGLWDRGELKKGKSADIVVFNPRAIRDNATYENPNLLAEGVSHVLVNGVITFRQGMPLGVYAGVPLP